MQSNRQSAAIESLSGLVERVTFFNEENGFSVVKVKAKGHRDFVTVVGTLPSVSAGEWLTAEGQWVRDAQFGLQFRANIIKSTPPTTLEGIEKYLGSGMVKGIGPVYAKKLVEKFGEEIFDIIENFSGRLQEVEGIGPMRRGKIKAAWADQKIIREIMVFLHSHGVSTSRAVRIYKTYGENAIERVRANPYLLANEIHGIGFKTADEIAKRIGIAHDSLVRACAGLEHVLGEAMSAGHCALPLQLLKDESTRLLAVDEKLVDQALDRTLAAGGLVREKVGEEELIFLPRIKAAEDYVATLMRTLANSTPRYPAIDIPKALEWFESKARMALAPTQRDAVQQALTNRILIITGGPGVGKTTIVNAILKILRAKKVRCALCAPTGRAAKRMFETTGLEAKTIHRLLEARGGGAFARDESNPLECDLLVVDECSMVDLPLMNRLLRAFPASASLLLVGDVDQLPSVGPGMVLRDLIDSGVVPVARLTEVFRQAADSKIITSAHQINAGHLPHLPEKGAESDFFFIERNEPDQIAETLLDMVKTRIPAKFRCDAIRDIQVLAPMNRGSLGIRELNARLQDTLNPARANEPHVEKFGWQFRVRDKVIQTENNYDKDVFNGDIGQIRSIDPDQREVVVQYDNREVTYDYGELDEVSLAYAITIHKSQGSEFPVVVIPLATQQFVLLQRNLVYTGITRGKKLVVLIGQRKALAIAVKNNRTEMRYSGLLPRLKMTNVQ